MSSGIQRHEVKLKSIYVSEERIGYIFRVCCVRMLVSCLAYSSALKKEGRNLIDFQPTTLRDTPHDETVMATAVGTSGVTVIQAPLITA
jgi:hypothetical protein